MFTNNLFRIQEACKAVLENFESQKEVIQDAIDRSKIKAQLQAAQTKLMEYEKENAELKNSEAFKSQMDQAEVMSRRSENPMNTRMIDDLRNKIDQ